MDIEKIYNNVLDESVDSTFLKFKELTKEAISTIKTIINGLQIPSRKYGGMLRLF